MLLSTVLIIIIITIIAYTRKKSLKNNSLAKIKSDPSVPFFGHVFKFGKGNENIINILEEMWIKYGRDKFILKIGPFHQIVLTKPDDVAAVLLSKENIEKNFVYITFKQMFSDSVLTYPKEKWQIVRKIVSPAFSHSLLKYYVNILGDEATCLLETLNGLNNKEVDIQPILHHFVLKAVCRNVLGFEMKTNDLFKQYLKSINILLQLSTSRVFSSWKLITPIYNLTSEAKQFQINVDKIRKVNKHILNVKREEIKDVIEKINPGTENIESLLDDEELQKISFVHLLLLGRYPNGEPLTIDEMSNEMHLFVVGGFETSVSVISFGLYSLAVNPDIQVKAFEEQVALTGGDLTKKISYIDISEMKYLDCFLKETMRMYSPAPIFGRTLSEAVILKDGIELPIGTNILFLPFLTHNDPEYYPNPDKFKPDRFTEGLRNQYAFYPFSLGPRNCVGQKLGVLQAKLFLATVLRNFTLLPPHGDKPKLIINPLLKSSTGVNIRLQKRI